MMLSKTLGFLTFLVSISGCISSAPVTEGYKGSDAVSLIAGEHTVLDVVGGKSTTVRLLEVNGIDTGAGRYRAGSVNVPPGLKRIAVRLWGHPPGFGGRGAEAFTCIEFFAGAGKTYLFSGLVSSTDYRLLVHDKSLPNEPVVIEAPVGFTQKLASDGCVQRRST